jgi:CHAT domain-containing protein/tetratricopeptide (TPR) repeat protein
METAALNVLRKVVLILMAPAVLVTAPLSHAAPVLVEQAPAPQGSGSQPDVKALIDRADKFHAEGKYGEAAAIWQQVLANRENALGPDHPDVALSLSNLAVLLRYQRQYAAAEPLFRRSLGIRERALGPEHPAVATSLNDLARLLSDQGQYAAAEPLYRRSLGIREKALGPDHPAVATSLNDLARLLSDQGQYAAAEPLYRRSLGIRKKALGPDHPGVATSLNDLAGLLTDQGQYAAAEPLYRLSLGIREKALGPDHPDVASSLNDLAGLLIDQGQYGAAEALYRRSMAIREKALGPDHPDVGYSLNNLAGLLIEQGKYANAEPFVRRSLTILEKALGPNHSDVATILNSLAVLLSYQGHFTAAEPLLRRSLAIREKALEPNHPDVAKSLSNHARLLMQQGQYEAAEPLFRRSLAILEKALGPDHPDVSTSLNNMAELLRAQGQYAAAEPLYRRSLAIGEKALGPNHPDVAKILHNLAGLMGEQGQYEAAEPLFRRSLAILEKALGPNHSDVAAILHSLAVLLSYQGQFTGAEPILHRSLAILEKALGPDHPDVSTSLNNLAELLSVQGYSSRAVLALDRSLKIQTTWLLRELPHLPVQARTAQLRRFGSAWEFPFGLIAPYPPAEQLALETRLNRQGLLPEIEQRQVLLLNTPGVDRNKVVQLQALTQQLASVALPPERRVAARDQRDKLQAELYRQIPELQLQLVSTAAVAKALPADGALVEFQRYRPFDGRKPKGQRWGEAQYIALVLKPDATISAVPLGPAAVIDALVHKGLSASAQNQSDSQAHWAQLSHLVLKPLLPHLSGSRQWFLSPDGELNRVPFAALPAPQQPGLPLAQAVQLRLLTTGRELVRLQQPPPAGNAALVMANPNYNRPGATPVPTARPASLGTGPQRRSAELGSSQWAPLPASEREGQQVASLLATRLISDTAATTTALQRQPGPRVLHIATHGFFVADQESTPTDPLRVIQEGSPLLRSLRQEDPQLRSGLVLAGANQPSLDPTDDGYLTAAEALSLKLKGTELVVLSACSTGQGESRTGEGVYGLQRSLTVAGARSTLLSLWKVDDAATADFMTRYYTRLKAGEGRADALAAVQAEFRNGTAGNGQWKEPYYWAAWQLVGDWRPVQGV